MGIQNCANKQTSGRQNGDVVLKYLKNTCKKSVPLPEFDSPTPSPASECVSPLGPKGAGGTNSDDWTKSLAVALCILYSVFVVLAQYLTTTFPLFSSSSISFVFRPARDPLLLHFLTNSCEKTIVRNNKPVLSVLSFYSFLTALL
jgi:hypothetical protein